MHSSSDIKLEVCVDSIESAIAAAQGGAARIELCSALSEGGLTPTVGMLKTLKALPLNIPIFCMLRPRRGNDFQFSNLEMQALLSDMDLLKQQGADGFVFGSLNSTKQIHVEQCQKVLQNAKGLPVTFHRAFDVTNPLEMHETVKTLIELGFQRLLSSGFRQTALAGIDALAQLIAKHHKDIIIMPGAGINTSNLEEILTGTKCLEFHGSCMSTADTVDYAEKNCTKMDCDVNISKLPYDICDIGVVQKMVTIAKAMTEK